MRTYNEDDYSNLHALEETQAARGQLDRLRSGAREIVALCDETEAALAARGIEIRAQAAAQAARSQLDRLRSGAREIVALCDKVEAALAAREAEIRAQAAVGEV